MAISVFDLFSIGIGPSSSHTVGPMRAAHLFARRLKNRGPAGPHRVRVRAELFGSLGAAGHGHGTPKAVLLGLEGNSPRTVDVETADAQVERIRSEGRINCYGAYYGCCILALSGHQTNPPSGWTGGDRLAIHGTDNPATIGTPASAGCLRASDADLQKRSSAVPLGTPVFIGS